MAEILWAGNVVRQTIGECGDSFDFWQGTGENPTRKLTCAELTWFNQQCSHLAKWQLMNTESTEPTQKSPSCRISKVEQGIT